MEEADERLNTVSMQIEPKKPKKKKTRRNQVGLTDGSEGDDAELPLQSMHEQALIECPENWNRKPRRWL